MAGFVDIPENVAIGYALKSLKARFRKLRGRGPVGSLVSAPHSLSTYDSLRAVPPVRGAVVILLKSNIKVMSM